MTDAYELEPEQRARLVDEVLDRLTENADDIEVNRDALERGLSRSAK